MAEISTALIHENEIAKADDFLHGFISLIKNTSFLDRMLVSANADYVIGGEVFPVSSSFGIRVRKLYGNGNGLELPVFLWAVSDVIPLILPIADNRIDTLQVKSELEEYDEQRRSFFNDELSAGQYFVVPTKFRLKTVFQLKQGIEGQEVAPDADAGWVKLAEICLEPGMVTLPEKNIRNITAIFQNEENKAWTNQKNRTFSLGSALDLKTMLAKEHNIDGTHRDKVIHASNIDFGIGSNQVNATKIPLGKDYELETAYALNALESLYDVLAKEMTRIKQIDLAIEKIIKTIDGLMPKAPADGQVYGGTGKNWKGIAAGGGGGNGNGNGNGNGGSGETGGDYHELLKAFSKKSLMLTNRRIADRRRAGWDIGLPYLAAGSRVYHFDTDLNDQNQASDIMLSFSGEPPVLKGRKDTDGEIFFNPAVIDKVPYEMTGRSLYGFFSLAAELAGTTYTIEAWIRYFNGDNAVVLRLASAAESLVFMMGKGKDPEYSVAEDDGIEYSVPDSDGVRYCAAGILGNSVMHTWSHGIETENLDDLGFAYESKAWLHIAVVSTPTTLSLFAGKVRADFMKRGGAGRQMIFILNKDEREFNVDELSFNPGAALNFDDFADNTDDRIPYAALDYRQKWFVLEAQDPALIKTNLFESQQFRTAVQAVIDSQ